MSHYLTMTFKFWCTESSTIILKYLGKKNQERTMMKKTLKYALWYAVTHLNLHSFRTHQYWQVKKCCLKVFCRYRTIIWKDTCTPVFTAALFTIAKIWKPPKCRSTEEWTKKMWRIIYNGISLSHKDGIVPLSEV